MHYEPHHQARAQRCGPPAGADELNNLSSSSSYTMSSAVFASMRSSMSWTWMEDVQSQTKAPDAFPPALLSFVVHEGHTVVGVDNLLTGSEQNLAHGGEAASFLRSNGLRLSLRGLLLQAMPSTESGLWA